MNKVWKVIKAWGPSALFGLVVSVTFNAYVAQGMHVPTGSMLPTIQIGDKLFVEKMVSLTDFAFGDVVVFHPPLPGHEEERYIKRLIGLPGDVIEVRDGRLLRNGGEMDEPYVKERMRYSFGPVEVPADHYLFLGDNRNDSLDSHLWPTPFVEKSQLVGKAMFRYAPLGEMGRIE